MGEVRLDLKAWDVDTLEAQAAMLGGSSQQRAAFRQTQLPVYRALIRLLVEDGDPAGAFAVLERARRPRRRAWPPCPPPPNSRRARAGRPS